MSHRLRALAAVAALTVGASALAGCSLTQPQAEESAPDLVVGAPIEITGPGEILGKVHEKTLPMVVDQINERGIKIGGQTRKMRLVMRDTRGNPDDAATLATAMIDKDKVSALVATATSPGSMKVVPVAEARHVPMMSLGSSDKIVKGPNGMNKYVFKLPADPKPVVDAMVKSMKRVKGQKIERVAMIAPKDAYGDSGVAAVTAAHKDNDLNLVAVQQFPTTEKDYSAQVNALLQHNPDVVIVWSIFPNTGYVSTALKEAGYGTRTYPRRVYFDTGAGAESFLGSTDTRRAADGMYLVHPVALAGAQLPVTNAETLARRNFFTQYSRQHGNFSGFATYSADALKIIATAAEQAQSTDPTAIRDAIEKMKYSGISGPYNFSPQNHGGVMPAALGVFKLDQGTWVWAEE